MTNSNNDFDFESFKQAAIKGLYEGKPLTGEDGLFAPLLNHFLKSALEGEMTNHLLETRQRNKTAEMERPLSRLKVVQD
ncbi:hypothetical protein DUE52_21910 [Larkinella punicea]|uniref:IS256 family transposase n=1 Tax=Larkinella punicea TaxID=2315727 RepID=A0A368JIH0_9BACT|nr:hypothetical protein [Larkinella punicea]RCR67460.1 hypothetical protein DUE52_21910 [Larkinella punicea]